MSGRVSLSERVAFQPGDATDLPFRDDRFGRAITIHVAINIAAKHTVYEHAKRVLRPGSVFAVYDVLQGEGGDVLFPISWASEPSVRHLATLERMGSLLADARVQGRGDP